MLATHRAARRRTVASLAAIAGLALLMPAAMPARADDDRDADARGAVYTETNAAAGNAVLVYRRAPDGSLTPAAMVPTGGTGAGAGLGSQGALALSQDGRWLLAVNAGTSDVSVFAVRETGLRLVSRTPSGGTMPISLTIHDSVVYVLNAGGAGNIAGFRLGHSGALTPIANSTRPLSGPAVGPAEVAFDPDGDLLVVTEKATNKIDTYTVGKDGIASGPIVQPSSGSTPFGFAFSRRGTLVVSEAAGFVSSYDAADDGALSVVTASAPTYGLAPCWIAITPNSRYAYAANAHGGTITGFHILHDGSLQILDANGLTASTGPGSAPLDMAVGGHGGFLHVLVPNIGAVETFRIGDDGSLAPVGMTGGIPASATGLVTR